MHEFAIARGLVEAAIEAGRSAGIGCITRLRCRIGDMRQVDGWLLDEAFAAVREGTPCATATLGVERTRMEMDCDACGRSFLVKDWDWCCPDCGACGVNAHGGDELELIGIDGEPIDEHQCVAERVPEE